ncbi:MAG: tRNA lysidine(34) synthetase TilS, partial [Gammaproteobacteria bacterium]
MFSLRLRGTLAMISSLIPDDLFSAVSFPEKSGKLLIAYSGGLDSHVLLHLFSESRHSHGLETTAVHVNHGLSDNARAWAEHCRLVCDDLKVDFRLVELDARAPRGESPEAWARHRRYEAIEHLMSEDDVLLTAHHMDDMAETLLIQLFRGAGPAGLSSMPAQSRFGKGWHYRPLLAYNRTQLRQYALDKGLVWIEDESNLDSRIDRNFLRNDVLPVLRQRWPSISRTLSRAARHQAEATTLLDDLAISDLKATARNNGKCLSAGALQRMSKARAGNTIRFWIKINGFPVPSEIQLAQIFTDVLAAQPDSEPCVKWSGTEFRRYRDDIFITTPLPESPLAGEQFEWDIHTICKLKLGDLYAFKARGEGI